MSSLNSNDEHAERARVVAIAQEWIGTPFHDHGEIKGRAGGVDCAKLLKCVFVEAGLIEPFDIGYYSPQHFQHQPDQRFLGFVERVMHEVAPERVQPGDVALFHVGLCYAHGAIVIRPGWPSIVHAHFAAGRVTRGNGLSPHLGKSALKEPTKFFSRW